MRLPLEREEAEAADREFVAVFESAPFDQLAVDEDAVEAAVVEDAQRVWKLGDDQGVATGDAGIVEAYVRCGTAADPGPTERDRKDPDLAVLSTGDVMARLG